MMEKPFAKKLLFVVGTLVSLALLTLLFLFLSGLKKQPPPTQQNTHLTPKDTTTTLIKSVTPNPALQLVSGQPQTFVVVLDPSIDPSKIAASLTSSPPSNALQTTAVPINVSFAKNTLTLTTKDGIVPVMTYTLSLSLRGTVILKQSYLSEPLRPTPLPSTDKTLASFLPHETHSYLLEFDESQNVYVVHFKYDPASLSSMASQMDSVKSEVSDYIKSKGVNPTSITVLYSYK